MSNGSPPIISAPSPPSAPGVPQPVIMAGQSLPPSFPLGTAGTWLPPPEVGYGDNQPFPILVVPPAPVPPSVAGVPQPQFVPPGSATVPTAASLFPAFTTNPPMQPIIMVSTRPPPPWAPPLPTTPGVAPIVLNGWAPGAGPGGLGAPFDEPLPELAPEPEPEPPATDPPEESRVIASGGGFVPPLKRPKGRGKHRG